MKYHLISFLSGVVLTVLLSFKVEDYVTNFSIAEVLKVNELCIFTDSRPLMAYDTLGIMELGFISDTQYESIKTHFMKRARKQYPDADGLILQFKRKGLDNCVVIKFR
jgi:hypothetical protein